MQIRRRELPADISASSYLGDQSVIQIGLPAALEASRSEWIVTFLHEAFHQFQASLPNYQMDVDEIARSLGQHGTDWILDYGFPYTQPEVIAVFANMNRSALAFLADHRRDHARRLVTDYVRARHHARAVVGDKDWRYFEFQVGQEGVARWSELRLSKIAGASDKDIASVVEERWAGLSTSLRAINEQGLGIWKRGAFYALGAVEAEMLEHIAPAWRHTYALQPFSLGDQLDSAVGAAAEPNGNFAS